VATLKLTVNLAKGKVAPVGECSLPGFAVVSKKIRWFVELSIADPRGGWSGGWELGTRNSWLPDQPARLAVVKCALRVHGGSSGGEYK
jgi:hypothetical protein